MSPLQVLKTALQMHQMSPTPPGESKEPVLMMPARTPAQSSTSSLSTNILKLKEILPNTSRATIAALLNEERGDLEAVISRVLTAEEEKEYELRDPTVIQEVERQEIRHLSSIPVDTSTLKDILTSVKTQPVDSQKGQVLSFHRPNRSTVPAQPIGTEQDPCSLALSRSVDVSSGQVCPSCLKTLEKRQDYNFCIFCGTLLKKNYGRL